MQKVKLKIIIFFLRQYLNGLTAFSFEKGGEKAVNIFSKPRGGRLNNDQRAFLDTSEKTVLSYKGMPIQVYFWQGEKPPVLLVHGWESNAARWKTLIQVLKKKKYAIVALDAPAHGDSGSTYFNPILYAQMMNEVVKMYQPEALVGHSVGGYATTYFLKNFEHPSVSKVILLASTSDNSVIFDKFLNFLGVNQRVHEAFYHHFQTKFDIKLNDLIAANYVKSFNEDALIIHDKDDDIVPFHNGFNIHKNWKNSELMETEGLGHRLRDKNVDKAVVEFLGQSVKIA